MMPLLARAAAALLLITTALPAWADEAPVKVQSGAAVKGVQTVVIGAFNVGFIFESVDRMKAAGGVIGAFSGPNRAKSQLVGVSPQTMQAITDAAYADFKAQLVQRGYVVAESAALFASPDFAKVKLTPTPYEAKVQLDAKKGSDGKGSYFKPSALPGMVLMPGDVTAAPPGGLLRATPFGAFAAFGGMGAAMDAGRAASAMAIYARSSGHGVIDVTYLIDFSELKRPGAFSFGGLKVTSGMSVVGEYSRISFVAPSMKTATLVLRRPVAVEGDFATLDDTTKDKGLQTASNIGAAAIGILGGAGATLSKSRTTTFTAKPVYQEGAIKAASLANGRLIEHLVSLR